MNNPCIRTIDRIDPHGEHIDMIRVDGMTAFTRRGEFSVGDVVIVVPAASPPWHLADGSAVRKGKIRGEPYNCRVFAAPPVGGESPASIAEALGLTRVHPGKCVPRAPVWPVTFVCIVGLPETIENLGLQLEDGSVIGHPMHDHEEVKTEEASEDGMRLILAAAVSTCVGIDKVDDRVDTIVKDPPHDEYPIDESEPWTRVAQLITHAVRRALRLVRDPADGRVI